MDLETLSRSLLEMTAKFFMNNVLLKLSTLGGTYEYEYFFREQQSQARFKNRQVRGSAGKKPEKAKNDRGVSFKKKKKKKKKIDPRLENDE